MNQLESIVEKAFCYVKDFFEGDYSGHDYYHTVRVYRLAKRLAKEEQGNMEIVLLAALLHDVDDRKLTGNVTDTYPNARQFLSANHLEKDRIEEIIQIISQVSFKGEDSVLPDTLEGKIVQDADRLDAIGAIGIARTFAYGGAKGMPMHLPDYEIKDNMTQEEYYQNRGTSIGHFYEKLLKLKNLMGTETGKRLAAERHQYMAAFLERFIEEWEM